MITIVRLITFQSLWFANVYLGKTPYLYFAVPLSLFFLFLDKEIFYKKVPLIPFINFSLFVVFSGMIIDSIVLNLGLISFARWSLPISSPFMWGMWIIFIPYYQIGFKKFNGKILLSVILALVFAPISYYSGSKIGSIILIDKIFALSAIGILWALFFPLSINLYEKLKGHEK
jgi:hypothetical protein